MAVGFGTLIVAIFTTGLLQAGGAGDLRQSVQISFITNMLIWIAALIFKTHRIR